MREEFVLGYIRRGWSKELQVGDIFNIEENKAVKK